MPTPPTVGDSVFWLLAKQVVALGGTLSSNDTVFSLEAKLAGLIGSGSTGGGGGGGTLTFAAFGAMSGYPPAANYATFDTVNAIPVLDFPSGSTNGIFFVSALPQGALFANGLKVNLIWVAPVTSGNVSWGASFEDSQAGAISADRWLTQVTSSAAASGTASKPTVTSITVPTASLGTLAPESAYRLRIQRITGDTLAGIAQLMSVTVEAA